MLTCPNSLNSLTISIKNVNKMSCYLASNNCKDTLHLQQGKCIQTASWKKVHSNLQLYLGPVLENGLGQNCNSKFADLSSGMSWFTNKALCTSKSVIFLSCSKAQTIKWYKAVQKGTLFIFCSNCTSTNCFTRLLIIGVSNNTKWKNKSRINTNFKSPQLLAMQLSSTSSFTFFSNCLIFSSELK